MKKIKLEVELELKEKEYKQFMEELKDEFGTNDFEKVAIILEHYIMKDKPKELDATVNTSITEIDE